MLEIGISGGTFSPIHNQHLIVARCAHEQHGLHETLFVPNGNPAHKDGTLDKEERFAMVELAVRGHPYFRVSRVEVDRPGKSYMVDTLRELKRQYGGGARLNLIVGLDSVDEIPSWYQAPELLKLCRLLIAPRGHHIADPEKIGKILPAGADFKVIVCPTSTLSSTEIRERRKLGLSIRYMVPEAVEQYMIAHRLYLK